MSLAIDSDFDGGNIRCLQAAAPDAIRLEIVPDAGGAFFQWFYFRLSGAAGRDCVLRIENAGAATYPEGWRGYRAVASEDGEDWLRIATAYDGRVLTMRHRPVGDAVWFAYFAPYSMARHAALIARATESPLVTGRTLGATLDGARLDLLEIGEARERTCWVIGRQHPGETMAEWWMEGFLEQLIDPADAMAHELLEKARFLRGAQHEPRRQPTWPPPDQRGGQQPQPRLGSTEHGGEPGGLPRQPAHGAHRRRLLPRRARRRGAPLRLHRRDGRHPLLLPRARAAARHASRPRSWRRTRISRRRTAMRRPPRGKANLGICANHVAETFGCLAMTLEQPFKDAANAPDPRYGWSPVRCRRLGRSCLEALAAVIDTLR